jgi:hypothetical protein
MALDAKVQKEMPESVPIEANEANYIAGAHEYLTNCAPQAHTGGRDRPPNVKEVVPGDGNGRFSP